MRVLFRLALAAGVLSFVGCGDDSGDDGAEMDAGPVADETPMPTPPPPPPAASDDDEPEPEPTPPEPSPPMMDDEDAGIEDEEPVEETPPPLPSDGNALSVCLDDDVCNGDDLLCFVHGNYRGYCADDCDVDDDCPEIDGIAGVCSRDNKCHIDCDVDGEPEGDCPSNMACVEVASAQIRTDFVCQYPEPKDRDSFERCDGLRGDSDCMEGLSCDVFVGLPLLSELAEPYCARTCTEASDCDDAGSDATPVCDLNSILVSDGLCALECEEDDQCPGDMECITIDLLQRRCGYPL